METKTIKDITPAEMLAKIARIERIEAKQNEMTLARGRKPNGVWLYAPNRYKLTIYKQKLRESYRETREGICADIEKAGEISYATKHSCSRYFIQLYRFDSKSPSGRFSCGNVVDSPLAWEILREKGIVDRLSGSISHDYR